MLLSNPANTNTRPNRALRRSDARFWRPTYLSWASSQRPSTAMRACTSSVLRTGSSFGQRLPSAVLTGSKSSLRSLLARLVTRTFALNGSLTENSTSQVSIWQLVWSPLKDLILIVLVSIVLVNCVDRHFKKTPNKVALIWEKDEPGTHEKVTYK